MDANQLKRELQVTADQLVKDEHELRTLTMRMNDLKRKIPEHKRKIETMKRDLLAQEALTKRRADAIQQSRE